MKTPTGTLRQFSLTLNATLTLHPRVIDRVDDEWRSHFYDLYTPEEIAGHVGLNILQGLPLSTLSGWADMNARDATVQDIIIEHVCEDVIPSAGNRGTTPTKKNTIRG